MPAAPENIPLALPWLDEREAEAAKRAIMSAWVTQGPEVAAFESEFAEYVGARRACAVSSCTAALHLALIAVGVKPGDEVITVSHSFIATANAVAYCGAKPVFVDIQQDTFNIDPERIESVIGAATRAIVCVHQMGMPCDLAAIAQLAARKGLAVIEDAACAAGSEILWKGRWEKIGKPHGDIACFSFHPRKVITAGDGGMLTTDNAHWDELFRRLRVHGMSLDASARHRGGRVAFESYLELGFNYRLTDIQAAVGREQLRRLPAIVARRRELADNYNELLSAVAGAIPPAEPAWARSNWQSYCLRLPAGCDQIATMQAMRAAGISTRRGIMCSHREPAYRHGQSWSCGGGPGPCGCPSGRCRNLRQSENAQDRSIFLPLYHQMTWQDQARVVAALQSALAESRPD